LFYYNIIASFVFIDTLGIRHFP